MCKAGYAGYTVWLLYPWYCTRIHLSVNYLLKLAVAESFFCHFLILLLSWCDVGILVNKDGIPEEEENFDEAIRAVNMALVPTTVRSRKKTISIKLCCSFRTTLFCQLIQCSNLTVVHSSKTSKKFRKRVVFFPTCPLGE